MAGNLESQVSVLCLNPTGVAASISAGTLRCDRASGDPVEKQVFADCPDRGTTAAVGGKPPFERCLSAHLQDTVKMQGLGQSLEFMDAAVLEV